MTNNNNNNRSTRVNGTGNFSSAVSIVPFGHSEVDQRILELNQQGHSIGKISSLLYQLYNIQLSKSSVRRHLTELMQDPDNNVQKNYECHTQALMGGDRIAK